MQNITLLINKAKKILKKTPYDVAHGVSHHDRVWKNVQEIVEDLDEPIDLDVLKVATYWHDVTLGEKDQTEDRSQHVRETIEYLQQLMDEYAFPKGFQEAVINVIRSHEFTTKKQDTIEAKVLFDADKLDAFHKDRYTILLNGYKDKKFSKMKLFLFVKAAKLWLRTVQKRFHFDVSRKIYQERISQLLKDEEAVQTAKELGIDIAKLVS